MATSIHIEPTAAAQVVANALAAAPAGGTPAPTPTAGSTQDNGRPGLQWVIGAFALVVLTALVTILATTNFPYSKTASAPVAGLTIFAVFFVGAQGIERLLEPVASFLGETTGDALTAAVADAQSKVNAAHAVSANGAADPGFTAASTAAQTALDGAAEAKAAHATDQANRTVMFWAIASSVGILAAGIMKLYLLTTVGVADPGRVLDVIATGLIIGAGTKPLHDLVTLISAQKSSSSGS